MPDNGTGTYSLPLPPFQPLTTIESAPVNNTLTDIAGAITNRIARDGQTTPTGNLPMGGFRHLNVASAFGLNEYATVAQIMNGQFNFAATNGASTGNNIILSTNPVNTTFNNGTLLLFYPIADSTGAVTVTINGVGPHNLRTGLNHELSPGALANNQPVLMCFRGGAIWEVLTGQKGVFGVQGLSSTTSATYTPTPGTRFYLAIAIAGGGGGGGAAGTGGDPSNGAAGAGGGSGGWGLLLGGVGVAVPGPVSYICGIGGAGGVGNAAGSSGGQTFFGPLGTNGGVGGGGGATGNQAPRFPSYYGAGGVPGSGGSINSGGNNGLGGRLFVNLVGTSGVSNAEGGAGASSLLFPGGNSPIIGAPGMANGNGGSFGAGGSGGVSTNTSAATGGAGGQGLIYVFEWGGF